MNTKITILAVTLLIFVSCQPIEESGNGEEEGFVKNGIEWEGENETANYLSMDGMVHYSNVEFDKAFVLWDHAVQVDSTLFAPHTMLALMSGGEKKEYHENMARKYVEGKNETSKKFVSLLDIQGPDYVEERKQLWKELHEMSNGPWIHFRYAWTLNNPEDQTEMLAELDNVIDVCLNEMAGNTIAQTIAGACYNFKAYLIQQSGGDLNDAVEAAEKYMELYPGHNSTDTRAEFYLFEGDTAKAIELYQKVIDMYPYSTPARQKLEELSPQAPDSEESTMPVDSVAEAS